MVLLEFIKEILLDVLRCIVMELNCKIINYLFKINVTGSMSVSCTYNRFV